MVKRKRDIAPATATATPAAATEAVSTNTETTTSASATVHLQIVTGTYEKTLHGFIVNIPPPTSTPATGTTTSDDIALPATFTDTFLFAAHTSPLRTLAISPAGPNTKKRILATSSADERINLYTLSTRLPPVSSNSLLKPLSGRNRHLGTLHNHLNTPTSLIFTPNRNKFLSAGADGQIQILRTRDWGVLSTLKVPKPKAKPVNYVKDYGEGYGPRIDAFGSEGYGGGSGAVNDIALHPSQKILLSVGAGERAVRMWNLMTGRKAGVLAFGKEVLPPRIGKEGMRVEWAADGESYAVAFDRGVIVFGMDSKPRVRIETSGKSKIHMMRFVQVPKGLLGQETEEVLALSTEDGRMLFYSTTAEELDSPILLGTLGGRSMGMPGRVKDFIVMRAEGRIFVITAGSDGVVRVFDLCGEGSGIEVVEEDEAEGGAEKKAKTEGLEEKKGDRQVGKLVGMYETARRITCMTAMLMQEGGEEEQEDEEMGEAGEGEEEESSDEESDNDNE
ncbi:WD40-repeat-containing domain protein [Tricharina praecox]|uniref:WD40-repeat-containing domain protein n=1 Tax=Tricharina praecox TaxID=43433 RepID=UPI00222013A7|nr:WD40-repeat-containing domain protein [Tricharina praecox]KAI5857602.1 WD40-repeat-containing domain protein [Tricharina praecox]